MRLAVVACVMSLVTATTAAAEVVRVEILKRTDMGRYEKVLARVDFAIDPDLPANRRIADITLAPRNAQGFVEFSSDVLVVRPKDPRRANGTVLLEVVNRGRDQSLGLLSGAVQHSADPAAWEFGDRFALERGFTLVFLGWQFDVAAGRGLGLRAPVAPVNGVVRATAIEAGDNGRSNAFPVFYCAADPRQGDARLTKRARIDEPGTVVPREAWQFGADGCSVNVPGGLTRGLYEAVYRAQGSPIAGVGLAAVRDFSAYLKHGTDGAPLRENPSLGQRVLAFGYSQSGRFLREFVRDGFNADERGRIAMDGLFIASAGAGGGSFNHRFAQPGLAGNSVLSILRPVDLPPFTDDGLLARAQEAGVVPRIFYTFSSTEYWARAGSLTVTTDDGTADIALASSSRLYFLSGTPHAGGPFPPIRTGYAHDMNFADQRWVMRALLIDLEAWMHDGTPPPASRYPTIAAHELVPRADVTFPRIPTLPFPSYMPRVWRMDQGQAFAESRVITNEPPVLGLPFAVLVPQVDADGNDRGGVRLPEVAVPIGTFTGWNVAAPALPELDYLGGLIGSFEPFPRTKAERRRSGDARLSIEERYDSRDDYLARVSRAIDDLVRQRLMLGGDRAAVLARAGAVWDAIAREAIDKSF